MAATGSGIRFEVVERRCWHRSVMAGCCCWDEDIMVDICGYCGCGRLFWYIP